MINSINSDISGIMYDNAAQNTSVKSAELNNAQNDSRLRKAFDNFVGETFFTEMLKSMRNTVGTSTLINGGSAEKIFQQQLDQIMAQKMAETSADKFTGPMYELFTLQRQ
jgi:Rod binding domain-containing protein